MIVIFLNLSSLINTKYILPDIHQHLAQALSLASVPQATLTDSHLVAKAEELTPQP